MIKNLDEVIARQENLDEVKKKSNELSIGATRFRSRSNCRVLL